MNALAERGRPDAVRITTVDELDAYARALVDQFGTPIVYVGHPVSGDVTRNLHQVRLWLHFLLRRWPGVAWIAPWVLDAELLDDSNDEDREAGLRRDEAVITVCDAFIMLGGRVSSGMARERVAAERTFASVADATALGRTPPVV